MDLQDHQENQDHQDLLGLKDGEELVVEWVRWESLENELSRNQILRNVLMDFMSKTWIILNM